MAKVEAPTDPAEQWTQTIAVYEREYKKWEQRVEKILKRYRDDTRNAGSGVVSAKFNILWSNVQTAIPAVFSRLPKPDVSRRHRDSDPVGRVAALLLERALEFEVDHYPDYRAAMNNCVADRFLGGRGVAWVRYEPHIKSVPTPEEGVQVTEDADEQAPQEELEYECAPTDYVHWKDFGHTIARTWEEVTGIWRKVYMGREALVERFGEDIGNKIPLDTKPQEKKDAGEDTLYEALIYEIWDKTKAKAYWLSKSLGKFVDEKDDPLKLENFWPCPRPLYATLTTDSLIPVPDFTLYQDQAATLDVLADRIDGLIRALQVKGVYDASQPELARLFTEGSNLSLLPVKNWMAFAEKQGLKGAIDIVDLTAIAGALKEAYAAVDQIKNQVWEITGLADIIRGSTDPNETATAQKMKGQFGSMRLRAMQGSVAQFAAELLQIKAQIICKQFQPQTILEISAAKSLQPEDQAIVPQAIQLLKNSPLRDFRIEVTADSMIQMDEAQEKQDRLEFLKSTSDFLKNAVPAGAENPQLAPLLMEMLKFGVTGFKVGKTIEGVFDEAADALKKAAQQPQQKTDPALEKVKAEAQADQQRMQLEEQKAQRELQAKQAYDQFKANLDAQVEQSKQQAQAQEVAQQQNLEAQKAQHQAQLDAQVEQHKASLEAAQGEAERAFEQWKAKLDAGVKIVVAQIAAASKPAPTDAEGNPTGDGPDTETPDALLAKVDSLVEALLAPRELIRDETGRATGSQIKGT